ncbi:hypothetical protein M9H77_07392 [Catharanthus roseus]|uniref:Uncharacterized protein n=1 Tax=Catharanthus roseus TaxID=4058 RepID=A0ACC0BV16_CATRO|nr:hypothetical protein M9H77_07392 [Catharanthus roseus]
MKALSQAGHGVLIKSVAQSLPSYVMQTFLVPQSVCTKMNRMVQEFWWGHKDGQQRKLHLKAWDSICAPKLSGGLGFLLFKDVNKPFIAKLGWQLCINDDKQWIKFIKSKYLRGRKIWDVESCESGCSWVWRSIWDSREVLLKGARFCVLVPLYIKRLFGEVRLVKCKTTKVRIDAFKEWTLQQWIQEIVDPNNCFPLRKEETEELLNLGVIAMEAVWKIRNHTRLGEDIGD